LRRAEEIRSGVARATRTEPQVPGAVELVEEIERYLAVAEAAALTEPPGAVKRDLAGAENSLVESALGNLDAAEASQLRLLNHEVLKGHIPSIDAQVYRYLPKADPRRLRVEEISQQTKQRPLTEAEREPLICAFHAAASQRHREMVRLGGFFVVLTRATIGVALLALAILAFGTFWPTALPLCFHPEDKGIIACATEETRATADGAPIGMANGDRDDGIEATASAADYLVVEIVGLLAAAVAGIATLRRMRGTSTPYRLPVALALLKLPAGAISAVVGLLLIRGGFVPGLTALDSSAQIAAWAIIFGYAQQLVTGLIDDRARGVLDDVGGRGASGERPLSTA